MLEAYSGPWLEDFFITLDCIPVSSPSFHSPKHDFIRPFRSSHPFIHPSLSSTVHQIRRYTATNFFPRFFVTRCPSSVPVAIASTQGSSFHSSKVNRWRSGWRSQCPAIQRCRSSTSTPRVHSSIHSSQRGEDQLVWKREEKEEEKKRKEKGKQGAVPYCSDL